MSKATNFPNAENRYRPRAELPHVHLTDEQINQLCDQMKADKGAARAFLGAAVEQGQQGRLDCDKISSLAALPEEAMQMNESSWMQTEHVFERPDRAKVAGKFGVEVHGYKFRRCNACKMAFDVLMQPVDESDHTKPNWRFCVAATKKLVPLELVSASFSAQ